MPAFLLPDLGEGLTEAQIVTWHVRVGDVVAVDQAVVEVETAKAVVEVPVPFAGRVAELHGEPGDVLTVGQPLITVAAQDADGAPRVADGTDPDADGAAPDAASNGESGSVLVGYGTTQERPRRRRGPVAVVSPVVRRLARDAGIDVTKVRGTGRDGLITRRDVDEAIRAQQPAEPAPTHAPTGAPEAAPSPAPAGAQTRIPLRGARRTAAERFSRSRREIPEATVWVDADATGLLEVRAQLNADPRAPRIGLLALLARLAILGLGRYPELNSRLDGEEIVLSRRVNLGFAAQTDRGLVVPVVPDAQDATLEQLAAALDERTRSARDGSLTPAQLTGGTFTINNYGVFGVDGSAAIINHPEVAILGIGRIIERPWVVGGQVVPRHVTELTLAFDHRVCDGGTAGGFLRFVADCVESPATALRHL